MADLGLVAVMALVRGGPGAPLARILPASFFRWRAPRAPTLGRWVLAIGVTLAYRADASRGIDFPVLGPVRAQSGTTERIGDASAPRSWDAIPTRAGFGNIPGGEPVALRWGPRHAHEGLS